MTEYKTLSTVAEEIGWSVSTLRYYLLKHQEIKPARLKQGKHMVYILSPEDIEQLKNVREATISPE
jgi:hypothetical protein